MGLCGICPWPEQIGGKAVKVTGFSDTPGAERQILAIRSNRSFYFALNRAGQVYRWDHLRPTARRLMEDFDFDSSMDFVDWVPPEPRGFWSGHGCWPGRETDRYDEG